MDRNKEFTFGMIFSSIVFVSIVSPTFAFATKSSIVVNIQRGGCGSVTPPPIITVNTVSPNSSNHTNNRSTPKMCLQSSSSTTTTTSTSKHTVPSQLVTRRGNRNHRRVTSELQSVAIPSSSSESSLSSKDQESEATSDKCSINASSNTTTTTAIVRRFWDRCRTITTKFNDTKHNPSIESSTIQLSNPRVMACIYMGISMSLHYSGYEFVRNSALSLFTSDGGFPQPIAFPLMNGIISPISIYLLYIYTKQLEIQGPKKTLHNFTKSCITFIAVSSLILWQCSIWSSSSGSALTSMSRPIYTLFIQNVQRMVIALMFLFNNCYVFMIASQQWSFVDSIVTPNEGAQWFGILTGICSVLCTISAGIIPYILPHVGLIGMYSMTAATLYGTLLCGNRAYTIAEQNGFDPALQQNERTKKKLEQQKRDQLLNKSSSKGDVSENSSSSSNRISDAIALFRRVPTLRALMLEGISFQSLGTILSVAMIRALKVQIPDDIARSAYTGRFYACVSGISAFFQFVILPIGMKRLEPKHLWRIMPILPILVTVYQILFPFLNHNHISQLTLVASALFITKLLDYSVRVVIYNMAYQPLDFESRFVGKEIINVFGGRVGRSGMSLFLSGLTIFPIFSSSLRPLAYFACSASTIWGVSAWWLSTLLPTKADAQRTVVERRKEFENEQKAKKR